MSFTCPNRSENNAANRLQNYIPVPESGCWIWLGWWSRGGYGYFNNGNGSKTAAHRLFYAHYKGEIPPNMYVCHKCDTPSCVNPEHLFIGTPLENSADCVRKGRREKSIISGERHARSKLKDSEVMEILNSSETNQQAARRFGMSYNTIWAIRARRMWRHINPKEKAHQP